MTRGRLMVFNSFCKAIKGNAILCYHSLVTACGYLFLYYVWQSLSKDNIALIACKTCQCLTANLLAGSEAWQLDRLHFFNSSLVEQMNDRLAPLTASTFFSFLPFQLPLLSYFFTFHISPPYLLLSCRLSVVFQVFFSADAHFFFFKLPVCLSCSHSNPLPPSSLSHSLCVRVCRWLVLAGSVTRGNWGRVHFNRTNGNKLIHFHCCFWDAVCVAGKRTG